MDAVAIESTSLPKDPDRSHLADVIHFMDLSRLADEKLPAARATVERSKAAAVTARMELDKHQQWLGQHQELYAQAVKGCERRLKRKAFIGACKQTARLPIPASNYCLDWLIPPRSCISSPSQAESKAPGSHSGARSPERAPVCTDTSEAHSGNGSARTNMSDDDRTTPLGLFNYARSYWQSGVLLHDARAK